MTFTWTVEHKINVNFSELYNDTQRLVEFFGIQNLTVKDAISEYVTDLEESYCYCVPDSIRARLEEEFSKWLNDNNLTLPAYEETEDDYDDDDNYENEDC